MWCAALHLRSAVVPPYAMLISSANRSAPVLSVAPHITQTSSSWSSARGILRLLRPWTLSRNSAGVVACGHLFAANGGSYLTLGFSEFVRTALWIIHARCSLACRIFYHHNRTRIASLILLYWSGSQFMIWHSLPALARSCVRYSVHFPRGCPGRRNGPS